MQKVCRGLAAPNIAAAGGGPQKSSWCGPKIRLAASHDCAVRIPRRAEP